MEIKMRFKSELVFLTTLFSLIFTAQASLLEKPTSVDQLELNQKALSIPIDMKWSGQLHHHETYASLWFKHHKGKVVMEVELQGEFPPTLKKYQSQFQFKDQDGKKIGLFTYGHETPPDIHHIPPSLSLTEEMGIVHPPRVLEHKNVQNLSIENVARLIAPKQCVFYTGAGISAGVVPTMPELMRELGFSNQEKFLDLLDKALENPQNFIAPMERFYKACLYGNPSKAHLALKTILLEKNWGLITENLDLLHQRSGITPLAHDGKNWIKNNVSLEDLKKIDYVITVGLARDESGFLGWYKHHNPNGKIIALNLQQPSYVDEQDYLVVGDIQELIPILQQELDS